MAQPHDSDGYHVSYSGETCVSVSDNSTNDICPPGHYCPVGSPAPVQCPPGTNTSSLGLSSVGECQACVKGYYCPLNGTVLATRQCLAGYYCPSGTSNPTDFDNLVCPTGHYCPVGVDYPIPCAAGTYQDERGNDTCKACPSGSYCEVNTTTPVDCPPGYYCPPGSSSRKQYACGAVDRFCPPGSSYFRNVTSGYYTVSALSDDHLAEGPLFEDCQGSMQAGVAISPDCSKDNAASRRSVQLRCPKGHYCIEGVKIACPSGKYGGKVGLDTNSCSGLCNPGFYCGEAAQNASETQCGSPAVFCPVSC